MEINREMNGVNPVEILPKEIFWHIVGHLSWPMVQRIRIVQSTWKALIEDPEGIFIKTYFPKMNVYSFPYKMDFPSYIRIARVYTKLYNKLINLDLDAVSMTEDELKELTGVKTSQLSCTSSQITSKGLIQLLKNGILDSPICFTLSRTPFFIKERFTDEVLQECINQKIKFQALELTLNSAISSEKFCEFIQSGGLVSPCKLDLKGCSHVNKDLITALIDAKVTCDQLILSDCHVSQDDLFRLIRAGGLTPLCSFLFDETEDVNDELLTLLLEKEIQLQAINTFYTEITSAGFLNFIQKGGLASPCSIKTNKNLLTKDILKALVEKEIEIKALSLEYNENGASLFPELIEGLDDLLTNGKWSTPCELNMSGHWLDDSILDRLTNSKLVINKLCLGKRTQISAEAFCKFIEADHLSSIGSELSFEECSWLNSRILELLGEKRIKIKTLFFLKEIPDLNDFAQSLIEMSHKGVFNSPPCHVDLPENCNDIRVIEELASTGISSLDLCTISYQDSDKERFITLFRDPKSFKWLTQLFILECPWFDEECQKNLLKLRPRLSIINLDKNNNNNDNLLYNIVTLVFDVMHMFG